MNQKVLVRRSRERWSELLTEWNSTTRGVAVLPGRNDLPYALLELHTSGVFAQEDARDLDVLPIALEDAWTSAEFPSRAIGGRVIHESAPSLAGRKVVLVRRRVPARCITRVVPSSWDRGAALPKE